MNVVLITIVMLVVLATTTSVFRVILVMYWVVMDYAIKNVAVQQLTVLVQIHTAIIISLCRVLRVLFKD